MGKRKNPAADVSGITLLELLIAITIAGVVMGVTASLLSAPQALVRDIATSSQSRSLEERQGFYLADRLSHSYPLRRNFFTCNTGDLKELFERQAPIGAGTTFTGDVHVTQDFTVPFTAFSTLGARISGNTIRVTDVSKVGAGDLVLLSTINHPTVGGVFLVGEVDRDELTVTLSGDTVAIPADFQGCSLVAVNNKTSFSSFLDDPRMNVFGNSTGSFRLEVIRLARYFKQAVGGDLGGGLFVQVWPGSAFTAGAPGAVEPAVPGFVSLDFSKSSWTPEGGTSSANGAFTSTMAIRWKERSSTRNMDVEKKTERIVSANLLSGGQVNFGVNNSKAPDDITYPSCGIKLTSENGIIYKDDLSFGFITRIGTIISDTTGFSGVEVSVTGGLGQPVLCWHDSEPSADPTSGVITVPMDGRPPTTTFTITSNSVGGRSTYLCDAPPGTSFVATYVAFSARQNKLVRKECGTELTPSIPLNFEYSGPPSRCLKTGEISIGTLIARGTTEPGPVQFLSPNACRWEFPAGSGFTDCNADATPTPKGNLLNVMLSPNNIPGTLTGHTGAGNNELTCVDPT